MKKKMVFVVALVLCIAIGASWAFAEGAYTKDSGVVVYPTFVEGESGGGALSEALSSQLEVLYGTGSYTGSRVYTNGVEQIISVYRDEDKIGWHIVDADGAIELFDLEEHEYIFVRKSNAEKITAELAAEMEEKSDELIPVYVWLKDIDTEAITRTMSRAAGSESDQAYIMQKRELLSEAYTEYNNSFMNSVLESGRKEQVKAGISFEEKTPENTDGISFASAYTPMCMMELTMAQILEVVEDERVAEVGLIPDVEIVSYAVTGAASVQGAYVRDTNGHTGEGAIVGIIESSGIPDVDFPELVGADITVQSGVGTTTEHATRVASIICGQTVGLAPDCKVYATCIGTEGDAEQQQMRFIERMEWLLGNGVHVINASLGIPGYLKTGVYSIVDKWVDHVDMNHDVLVVSAAGNETGRISRDYRVGSPALSYNGIAVGAYDDNGDSVVNHSNDTFADFSCYVEIDNINDEFDDEYEELLEEYGDESFLPPEKPDLIAPGVDIDIPGLTVNETDPAEAGKNDGTSFAAPYVTATVAQMIDARPELKTQPAILKAALLASAFRKINPNGYIDYGTTFAFSDKEGAGKLDSKNAIYVIASTNYTYEYFWSSTQSYTWPLYANASETQMRVALTWLKQDVLTSIPNDQHDDSGVLDLVEDRPLSDWDLEIYDPNGNLVTNGYSRMRRGNVEIVEFDPQITGTYTIKIIKVGGATDKEFVYLAWW